ncbi:MAG: hypothetical protein HY870_15155 [Chloroflexi bacterium]|nr:hypothetical protein [Chloroflexota bacterium]
MPEFRRQTRAYTLDQLQPELGRVIREHLEAQHLTSLANEVVACCETISDKVGASWSDALFGDTSDFTTSLALVLAPQRLIWARSSDRSAPTVASAPLNDLIVKVFRPGNTRDFGLKMTVRIAGTRTVVNGELLLGPEPAAEKFCVALGEAMGVSLLGPPPKPWWDRLWGR